MAYTTIDDPSAYFQTKTYTGTDASPQAFTLDGNSDLQPDWVWIKNLGYANKHVLFDSVRGVEKSLTSNSTAAEVNQNSDGGYLSAFNSDGFTLTEGSSSDNDTNDNRYNYAAWNWKAGTSVSGNTTGSGTAKAYSGSVSTDAGFSIITYLGNGTAGHTIPHHLGVVPQMIIVKERANANSWYVYHHSLGNTKNLYLNGTHAAQTDGVWNDTTPTSSVFTLVDGAPVNRNDGTTVAYCFAEKQGYSKFGSYIGNNNANGPFVHTGFKPAWLMIKIASGTTNNWMMYDNKRSLFNLTDDILEANNTGAEGEGLGIDLLSNGFKIRTAAGNGTNFNTGKYIYMAFAQAPFVTSKKVPTTAR